MKIYGITLEQAAQAAQAAQVNLNDVTEKGSRKPFLNLTLRPLTGVTVWRKVAHQTGRKVCAIDALGHAAFFVELFRINADAEIVSGGTGEHGVYFDGLRDFDAKVTDVLERNIGSAYNPIGAYDACIDESKEKWDGFYVPTLHALVNATEAPKHPIFYKKNVRSVYTMKNENDPTRFTQREKFKSFFQDDKFLFTCVPSLENLTKRGIPLEDAEKLLS